MRLTILMLVFLAGCASAPVIVHRSAQTDATFVLNGRIKIKQGTQHDSSGIHWEHGKKEDELLLLGPLGYTAGRIHKDEQGATLDDAYGKHFAAPDAEALMQKSVGWQLPLNGLQYWVVGMPVPEVEARVERNSNGQISLLKQQGWEIRYTRYAGSKPDALPMQLEMSFEELDVLLQIDEWK